MYICRSNVFVPSRFGALHLPKLDPFPEPTLNPVSIDFEIELPLLDSHVSLMRKECEIKFFDLDSTLEPKSILEPKVDFPELVMIPGHELASSYFNEIELDCECDTDPHFCVSFTFRIYFDYGILTQFGHISRANIYSCTYIF